MTQIAGRTAFITGAGNGIGLGIARALGAAGARVALVDIDAAALAAAREELSSVAEVATFVLDVRDRQAFAAVANDAESALGPVSLLFNNAGVLPTDPAIRLTYEQWDWGMGINVGGVINGLQTFLTRMVRAQAGGHIVNTASAAGLATASPLVLYGATKFAVVGLSEALKLELAATGIGVSVLCPGPVATAIVANTDDTEPQRERSRGNRAAAAVAQMDAVLQAGIAPDVVGELVRQGVESDDLYILTDRFMAPLIEARAAALLAGMPTAFVGETS